MSNYDRDHAALNMPADARLLEEAASVSVSGAELSAPSTEVNAAEQSMTDTLTNLGSRLARDAESQNVGEPGPGATNQFLELLVGQNEVLDLLGRDTDLNRCLTQVGLVAERVVKSSRATILIFDPDGNSLAHAARSDLPERYVRKIDEMDMDPDTSPLASAGIKCERIVVPNLSNTTSWAAFRQLALGIQLQACWAQPILSKDKELRGILALYFPEPRAPSFQDCQAIEGVAALARFAIEDDRRKKALRSANERFSSLATTVPGVVYQRVVSPNGDIRYTYISEAVRDLFGLEPEEVLANPEALFDCFDAEYRSTFQERLLAASRETTLWDVQATIIARDGKRKYTHAIARPNRQSDGSVVWDGVILDATRIREAELAAAAAEARTKETIVESIPQGFILYDSDDRFVTCNSRFLSLYPRVRSILQDGATYDAITRAEVETELDLADEADIGGSVLKARLQERLEAHGTTDYIAERRLVDGRSILINEHETADGSTVVLHTDISELKEREAALERSNRELQDFASVASHDLQEPLRKIEAFGDRLKDKCAKDLSEEGVVYLERMQNAAGRMRQLINDLLVYSRVTTKARPFVSVSINEIVSDVVADLQVAVEESEGNVEWADLPTIDADPMQMRLLFQNLISNALKFRRAEEKPHIKLTWRVFRNTQPDGPLGLPIGKMCEFSVADNGIGFDMKYLDRIFAIFQRLHGRYEYEGTGIGLATCRKIVERHNGAITAESEPGKGTKFLVTLPVQQTVAED